MAHGSHSEHLGAQSYAMQVRFVLVAPLFVVLLFVAPGCGYSLLQNKGTALGQHKLIVLPFAEQQIAGLSAPLTKFLAQALRAQNWTLVSRPELADATLTGDISLGTVPGTTLRTVAVYAVEARVHAELRDRQDTLLWQTDVALEETFLPTDPALNAQPLTTEMRRRTALLRLSELCAERIAEALLLDAEPEPTHG